jgi:hypothetical protein
LVDWRVLMPLERRIGGAGRGSSGSAFALDSVGQRLIAMEQYRAAEPLRVRRPGTPTERTLKHALAVSELYVRLVELGRTEGSTMIEYLTEPSCWWPNGLGGYVKPDAYARLERAGATDHWWIEQDQATESLPTLKRKLETYLNFVQRGQLGPHGVVPLVLVAVPTEARRAAVQGVIDRLPAPAGHLLRVTVSNRAAGLMNEVLNE